MIKGFLRGFFWAGLGAACGIVLLNGILSTFFGTTLFN